MSGEVYKHYQAILAILVITVIRNFTPLAAGAKPPEGLMESRRGRIPGSRSPGARGP